MQWRFIDSGEAGGAYHMATDAVAADHASRLEMITIRFYGWKPWCISLGYHQNPEDLDYERIRKDGFEVVRRPTGGRAVFHAQELTYSVVIPFIHEFENANIHVLYHRIGEALVRGLQKAGVPASLKKRTADLKAHYQSGDSVSCFSAAARHEVTVQGRKLVGSAQRRYPNALLQHGSLILGDSHLDLPLYLSGFSEEKANRFKEILRNKTASVSGILDQTVSYEQMKGLIKSGFEEAFDVSLNPGELTAEEKAQIEKSIKQFVL